MFVLLENRKFLKMCISSCLVALKMMFVCNFFVCVDFLSERWQPILFKIFCVCASF